MLFRAGKTACSSASLNWYNESMIVPNGSYALTATNCIKCSCGPMDLMLQCIPSGLEVSCYNLHCQGSNLVIGDQYVTHSNAGCNVTKCVYRGHRGGKILRSMMNSSYLQCPDNRNHTTGSCWPFSSSTHPMIPFGALASGPSPSPMPVSKANQGGMLGQATFINLLLLLLPQLVSNSFM
ncbi:hypothetical protein L6164_005316 [Bauhinia variegata]|uniref:Uncharacterized protein n=1 Tax=Bauhinia variegata TaxID=167791 RepID=A0ACB9PT12_BAUVA|nr:hypothetical protein L6164_005316 [Bauhinia variegata]